MPAVTQKQRVLDALQDPRGISPWYAIKQLGNTRLAATIFQLKKDGHNIKTIMENGENRFGDKITYARYVLIKDQD